MIDQAGPCLPRGELVSVITAVGAVVTTCFTAFLAHRRVKADRESRRHRRAESQLNYNMAQTLDDVQRKVNRIDKNGC